MKCPALGDTWAYNQNAVIFLRDGSTTFRFQNVNSINTGSGKIFYNGPNVYYQYGFTRYAESWFSDESPASLSCDLGEPYLNLPLSMNIAYSRIFSEVNKLRHEIMLEDEGDGTIVCTGNGMICPLSEYH